LDRPADQQPTAWLEEAFRLALITLATATAAAGCGSSGSKPAPQAAPTQPTTIHRVTT
jgi:hypothetical protein